MSDNLDEIASEDRDESETVEEVRVAWLGLIRLLAREVIRYLDQRELPSKADTKSKITDSTELRLRKKNTLQHDHGIKG